MKILLENVPDACTILLSFPGPRAAPDRIDPISDAAVNGTDHLSSDEQSQLYSARRGFPRPGVRAEYSGA